MPDIHIERRHNLGLPAAREVARLWVAQAEQDYGLDCSYAEGDAADVARFARAGIDGSMEVSADCFTLVATLGFLYGSFSTQIEQKLRQNLDELLGPEPAVVVDGGGVKTAAARTPAADDDAYNDDAWK